MERKLIQDDHLYWKLFTTCFLISACTFGGGMVIMSILQKKFVEELKWIDSDEMMDLIAIAQSSPGVMAVNSSIIIGYRVGGTLGAFVTMVGTILPPMIILSVISVFYKEFRDNRIVALLLKGMQAGVAAVIIHVTITMCQNVLKDKKITSLAMLIGAAVAAIVFNVDIILLIVVCGVIGGVLFFIEDRREKTKAQAVNTVSTEKTESSEKGGKA